MRVLLNKVKLTKIISFILDIFIIAISYIIARMFQFDNLLLNNLFTEELTNTIIISIIVYEFFLNLFEIYKNITI